jgi:hypothetical protein
MAESVRKPNKPNDPPYGGGEDETPGTPGRDSPPVPGEDVKEPPLPETVGLEEKFPRKGEL